MLNSLNTIRAALTHAQGRRGDTTREKSSIAKQSNKPIANPTRNPRGSVKIENENQTIDEGRNKILEQSPTCEWTRPTPGVK